MSERPTSAEVFADITCPFTHVGLRRLVDRRRELGRTDVRFRVRAWPLELVNGSPLDPAAVGDKIDRLKAHVAPDLFAAFDRHRFPSTSIPALALVARAYRDGPDVGEAVSLLVRDALFEEGLDISRTEVLHSIAHRGGIGPADRSDVVQVVADWNEGRRRGVTGSPHFFIAGQDWFCPALEISQDADGRIGVLYDEDRFERFVTACFQPRDLDSPIELGA